MGIRTGRVAAPESWRAAVRRLLPGVRGPAQYAGGERNQVVKDWARTAVRVAILFPDTYAIGMSHLGSKILYEVVNRRPDALAERCFAPWFDMEAAMRAAGVPLHTLESHRAVADFDLLAVALQYESLYSNLVACLDLAGIPRRSADREEHHPLVVAGGPAATAPEPVAEFVDLFVLGDGEEAMAVLCDLVAERKRHGGTRAEWLRAAVKRVPGAYAPSLYDVRYGPDGTVAAVIPRHDDVPARVPQAVVHDFASAVWPDAPVVPFTEVVHDRITLEIMRGCVHGCRFCHAGYTKRPMRYRPPNQLVDMAERAYRNTGHHEIGLTSLSSSDYPALTELMQKLNERFRDRRVGLSLPSLRVNEILKTLPFMVDDVRKSGLTLAPEVATDRLRTIINKPIKNEDLYAGTAEAFRLGWTGVKLYFMIGIPDETDDDVRGIVEMAQTVSRLRLPTGKGEAQVNVSVSPFIPKAHTPLQWAPQATPRRIRELNHALKGWNRSRSIKLKLNDPDWAGIEGVLSRGDRRLAPVIEHVVDAGGRFDGWSQGFDLPRWLDAFAAAGVDPEFYLYRDRDPAEVLPWDHLGAGVSKAFLARDRARAVKGKTTPGCWDGACSACGLDVVKDCKPGWLIHKDRFAGSPAAVAGD